MPQLHSKLLSVLFRLQLVFVSAGDPFAWRPLAQPLNMLNIVVGTLSQTKQSYERLPNCV